MEELNDSPLPSTHEDATQDVPAALPVEAISRPSSTSTSASANLQHLPGIAALAAATNGLGAPSPPQARYDAPAHNYGQHGQAPGALR